MYLVAKFGFYEAENEPCKVCPLSVYVIIIITDPPRDPTEPLAIAKKRQRAKTMSAKTMTVTFQFLSDCFALVCGGAMIGSQGVVKMIHGVPTDPQRRNFSLVLWVAQSS